MFHIIKSCCWPFVHCQAEVEEFGPPICEHDVAWFEVAMDDPLPVCSIQCSRHFDCNLEPVLQRKWARLQSFRKGLTLQIFHGDKRSTSILTEIVHRANIGVI